MLISRILLFENTRKVWKQNYRLCMNLSLFSYSSRSNVFWIIYIFPSQTGMLSALPWFCMTVMIAICGYVSDKLRKHLSVGATRKLFFNAGRYLHFITTVLSLWNREINNQCAFPEKVPVFSMLRISVDTPGFP